MVLAELDPLIQQKKLVVRIEANQPIGRIHTDPQLMKIVWQNLIANSIYYTPNGRRITISLKKDRSTLSCSVADKGIGIPKHQQSNIFKKMFRADNAITMQTDGTGLGLYISKSIIEKSGGKIWFESTEGKGTVFHFVLPRTKKIHRSGSSPLIAERPH